VYNTHSWVYNTLEGTNWYSFGNLALIIDEPLHVCVSSCEDEPVHEATEPL